MNKIILITGATSGFGKAIAEKFAASNWNLIITGRRKERLTLIAKELSSTYGVEVLPLVFDVQDKNAVFTTITGMPEKWKKIDVLVNNAGLALGRDNFENASLTDWETMLDTNVKGMMFTTRAVWQWLLQQQICSGCFK